MARGGPAQGLGVTAAQDRWTLENSGPGIGVVGSDDMAVTSGSGMSSVIAAGRCRIRATNSNGFPSGLYELSSDAPISRSHANANGAFPRLDQVAARIVDFQEQAVAISEDILIFAGLPTSGATLDNRNGAALLPQNSLLLADVLVPAGAGSSASFSYRDRRQSANYARVPNIRSAIEQVPFVSIYTSMKLLNLIGGGTVFGWVLRYLPSRITASKIRWSYRHTASAFTGNYNIGIYDASGRKIVETGVVAGTGGVNTVQFRSETIATTIFEPGMYYVAFGSGSGSGQAQFVGDFTSGSTGGPATIWPVPGPNMCGGINGAGPPGGTTFPLLLNSTIDNYTTSLTVGTASVPLIALSP